MENVQTLWDIFCVVIGVAAIGGGLYWTAKRIGLTTFIKVLIVIVLVGYVVVSSIIKYWSSITEILGPIVRIGLFFLILFGMFKLIKRVFC